MWLSHRWGRAPGLEWVGARGAAEHPTAASTALMAAVLGDVSGVGDLVLGGKKVTPHQGLNGYVSP